VDSEAVTIEKIWNREEIKYKVVFPLKNAVPSIKVITLDGQEICRGQPGEKKEKKSVFKQTITVDSIADTRAISFINLDYTIVTDNPYADQENQKQPEPKPNLPGSVQKYPTNQNENQNVAFPARDSLPNPLPTPIRTTPKPSQSQRPITASPFVTNNNPKIGTTIGQLSQSIQEQSLQILEEIKKNSNSGKKSVYFEHTLSFSYNTY
jgi:Serine protease gd N-terminus